MSTRPATPPLYHFFVDGSNLLWGLRSRQDKFVVPETAGRAKPIKSPTHPNFAAVWELVAQLMQRQDSIVTLYFDKTAEHIVRNWRDYPGDPALNLPKGEDLYPIWGGFAQLPDGMLRIPPGSGHQADDQMLSDAAKSLEQGYEVFLISNDNYNKIEDGHRDKYPELLTRSAGKGQRPARLLTCTWSLPIEGSTSSPAVVFARFPLTCPQWNEESSAWEVNLSTEWRLPVKPKELLARLRRRLTDQAQPRSAAPAPTPPSPVNQTSGNATSPKPRNPLPEPKARRALTRLVSDQFTLDLPGMHLRGDSSVYKLNPYRTLKNKLITDANHVINVGRDDAADIVVTESERLEVISREHLRITLEPTTGWYHATDLGSTNGTWLNETMLPPKQPMVIPEGNGLFRFASRKDPDVVVYLHYEHDPAANAPEPEVVDTGARAKTRKVDGTGGIGTPQTTKRANATGTGNPRLVVDTQPGCVGGEFEIAELPFAVGRYDVNDPHASGAMLHLRADSTVSRRHLMLEQRLKLEDGRDAYLVKQVSSNKTAHDGRSFGPDQQLVLVVNGSPAILAPQQAGGNIEIRIRS